MDCGKPFASKNSSLPPETGASAVGAAASQDLLPWPVQTRRRGSRSRPAVVAEPSNRWKPEKGDGIESLDLMDLPLKKRIYKDPPAATVEGGGGGGMVRGFDLNELPEPENEGEILLALRWYCDNGDAASEMCS